MSTIGGLIVVAAGAAVLFSPMPANARPQYQTAFAATYAKIPAAAVSCGVCHGEAGKNKKILSGYARDLKDSLRGPNVTDKDGLLKALRETENKVAPTGATWGKDLLNGKLPPRAKP